MNIQQVKLSDASQIAEIYNYYIENTHHTFETEAIDESEMRSRINEIIEKYPYYVGKENGEIIGYAYAAPYKSRCAYRSSAEVSVYVKNDVQQKGIGTRLYEKLMTELLQTDVHAVIAGIALPNDASVRLHEKFGFEKVAHFREVGWKFGHWIDVGYWELLAVKKFNL
ncbi:MAG TPA: arsinothricin resistance N-acetyltransferase ArsN1 family B [Pyrinomonadaceae bacterium]|jgi:phosphinothricin acetyltransferase